MLICLYCKNEKKNKISLIAHQRYCILNPNKEESRFKKYNEKIKLGEIEKKFTNQFDKANKLGIEIKILESTKQKISISSKERMRKYWNEETRKKHSIAMKKAVEKYPDSYNAHNVCGRVKYFEYIDKYDNKIVLKGTWEKLVAEFLDNKNIKWNIVKKGFEYNYNNSLHLYFPDFYLPEYDYFIEVKGYQVERDIYKWESFTKNHSKKLLIIKNREINLIKNQNYFDEFCTCIGFRS